MTLIFTCPGQHGHERRLGEQDEEKEEKKEKQGLFTIKRVFERKQERHG